MICMPVFLPTISIGLKSTQVQALRTQHASDSSTQFLSLSDGAEYVRAKQVLRLSEANGPPPDDLPYTMVFERGMVRLPACS